MSITNPQNIANLLSAFHDGTLILQNTRSNPQIWKIECEYLAELVNEQFSFFVLRVYGCRELVFIPWQTKEEAQKQSPLPAKIPPNADFEILQADNQQEQIQVTCHQHNPNLKISGGTLQFSCDAIELFDEAGQPMKLEELRAIFNRYWQSFGTQKSS